jgi:hypothetical protein
MPDKFLFGYLPNSTTLANQLRSGGMVHFLLNEEVYSLPLSGASEVLQTLSSCATSGGQIEARAPSPPPPAVAVLSSPASEHRLTATQFAANILSRGGFRDFRLLTTAEKRAEGQIAAVQNADVAWQVADALGTLSVITGPAANSLDRVASDVIGSDARSCPGEFATARMADTDMQDVRRVMTFCTLSPAASITIHYTFLPLSDGLAYQFMILGRAGREAALEEDRRLRDALRAALPGTAASVPSPAPEQPPPNRSPRRPT